MKSFRIFVIVLLSLLIVATVSLFIKTELQINSLNESKQSVEASYSDWLEQNKCAENPEPCKSYSEQIKNWQTQVEMYQANKAKTPEFKLHFFFKELDEQYARELNSKGYLSLALFGMVLLLFILLIARTLKVKNIQTTNNNKSFKEPTLKPFSKKSETITKPQAQALLRKAIACSESEPVQAISYLQQAIEERPSNKLLYPTLLLSGSLRLKNKIGEVQGKEQLERIIRVNPKSKEAKKAQEFLDGLN